VQIGGPTAAFIPVVFVVIERFGYGGLILCTLLAGLMLIAAGLLRLGTLMKYIPQPVVTGFTAGIAVTIFTSQVKDLLGLPIEKLPGEFFAKWQLYLAHLDDTNLVAFGLALACLALILGLKRWRPSWPGFLVAVVLGSFAALMLPVTTIGSTFGTIPSSLPVFAIPHIPFERTAELLPAAFTIAFLAGVESLLSAVVADGMTGGRHRSNMELVAQGVANVGSALVGGLPATGAIARTATNIRAGARSPVAGILHAGFLLAFMLLLAPLMRYVPFAALAAVLLVVAWNMSEIDRFRHLMRAPWGDRAVLLLTFVLTVAFDLTIAIEVGVVLAAFLFMHRMSEVVAVESQAPLIEEDEDVARETIGDQRGRLPPGVEAFRISGPLFFAVANRLDRVLDQFPRGTRVFILRMSRVPLVDASGATALQDLFDRCRRQGIGVILSGLSSQPREILQSMELLQHAAIIASVENFEAALNLARERAPVTT
jgi:SulP family sulfate permease